MILLSASIFALAACDSNRTQSMNQMQRLQVLVNQALITAAHGANLKLEGKPEDGARGQALLTEASGLLRRAMSGPEMAMMHKGGKNMSAAMKRTHDMGDAAFDLFGLMMALSPGSVNASQLRQANESLAMAASAAMIKAQAESADDFKTPMQKHAENLLMHAGQTFAGMQGKGAYHTLVGRLLEMLKSDVHSIPDKS